jgi:Arc/MetJ-type ribon-helix-helix transcriptional regulator
MVRMIISLPVEDKRWIEAESRRRGFSASQLIRLAIRELRARESGEGGRRARQVREDGAEYGPPLLENIADMNDLRRRAAAAAGRFASGVPDLSVAHDRHLAGEAREEEARPTGKGPRQAGRGGRRPVKGAKRGPR